MNKIQLPYYILLLAFGVFMFIYGGYDDSPGAQLLGLIAAIVAILGAVRRIRKASKSDTRE